MKRRLWGAPLGCALLAVFAWAPYATAADESIEEVVVTGSYIKRDAADSPSPLSVIDKAAIDELGAAQISDIVNSLTFNSGSLSYANVYSGGDSSTGNASINLRNLGNGSTLVLLDGKRTVAGNNDNVGNGYVDLQQLIPNIAIERVEVVKDGTSALYGSDAIAGVVNFITRQSFDGFEMQADYRVSDEVSDSTDKIIQGIFGIDGENGSMVIAASYLDRRPMLGIDRKEFVGSGLSTFGQPGRYVPLGGITATPSFFNPTGSTSFGEGADPDCNVYRDDGAFGGFLQGGVQGNIGGLCIYDFQGFFPVIPEEEQLKFHANGNYQLTDNIQLYGTASFSDNTYVRNNSLFPDVTFAIVPTDSPGLILDAQRRGIAPVPYLALQRMLGGTVKTPFSERPVDTRSQFNRENTRVGVGAIVDFDFLDRSWTLDTSVTRSQIVGNFTTASDTITSNTNAAFVGLGGPTCDQINGTPGSGNLGQPIEAGGCFYYNPFGTSRFDPVTGQRWDTTDTSPWAANPAMTVAEAARLYMNPDGLLQWMAGEIQTQSRRQLVVYDAVLTGELFDTDWGPIGVAVGFQRRHDEVRVDNDKTLNDNNFKFVFGAADYEGELTTTAGFIEIQVPLPGGLDANLAARYEDFDEIDENTFDPKLSLLWRPPWYEDLSLRASVGTSFRVGSLLQLIGSQTSLLNSTDAYSGTGGLAFRPQITTGSADLKPEEATTFNIGFSWRPTDIDLIEGVTLDVDYYYYDYDDIITREQHQALINLDNQLRCPNGFNSDPANGPLCGAIDVDGSGLVEPDELFNANGTVGINGAGIPDKVIRGPDGSLLRTQTTYLNAQSLKTSGLDIAAGWQRPIGDLGIFRARVDVSYTLKYDLTDENGNKIDGVGSRNAGNSVGHSLPQWKLNFNFGFARDRHTAVFTLRHIPEYDDDVPQSALRGSFGFLGKNPRDAVTGAPCTGGSTCFAKVDSMTTLDFQYSFDMSDLFFNGQGSSLTFGIINLTNEDPPTVNVDGGFDAFGTHDPRGRFFYGRYVLSLGQ